MKLTKLFLNTASTIVVGMSLSVFKADAVFYGEVKPVKIESCLMECVLARAMPAGAEEEAPSPARTDAGKAEEIKKEDTSSTTATQQRKTQEQKSAEESKRSSKPVEQQDSLRKARTYNFDLEQYIEELKKDGAREDTASHAKSVDHRIYIAIDKNLVNTVKYLLGCNESTKGFTEVYKHTHLLHAISKNEKALVRVVLEAFTNVNASHGKIDGYNDITPLDYALRKKLRSSVQALLECDDLLVTEAQLKTLKSDYTYVSTPKLPQLVVNLLRAGQQVNFAEIITSCLDEEQVKVWTEQETDNTLLHYVAQCSEDENVIRALLRKGALLNAKNKENKIALDVAKGKSKEVLQAVHEFKAKTREGIEGGNKTLSSLSGKWGEGDEDIIWYIAELALNLKNGEYEWPGLWSEEEKQNMQEAIDSINKKIEERWEDVRELYAAENASDMQKKVLSALFLLAEAKDKAALSFMDDNINLLKNLYKDYPDVVQRYLVASVETGKKSTLHLVAEYGLKEIAQFMSEQQGWIQEGTKGYSEIATRLAVENKHLETAKIIFVQDSRRGDYVKGLTDEYVQKISNECFTVGEDVDHGSAFICKDNKLNILQKFEYNKDLFTKALGIKEVVEMVALFKALGIAKLKLKRQLPDSFPQPEGSPDYRFEENSHKTLADAIKGFVDRFYDVIEPMKSTTPTAAAGGGGGEGN